MRFDKVTRDLAAALVASAAAVVLSTAAAHGAGVVKRRSEGDPRTVLVY